jgi:hypothetical protein
MSKPLPNPAEMAGAAINKELDKLYNLRSRLTEIFISVGRGEEHSDETAKKTDELSVAWNAMVDRQHALAWEVERRAGPGMSRLPRGYGPRRMP